MHSAATENSTPFLRLSAYYFFHFGALGALMPYWGPYLRELGLSEARIGIVFAVLLGSKVIAPNVWGWLGDRIGRRMPLIRGGALASLAAFAFLAGTSSFIAITLIIGLFGFFWNAILPQFEATTLNHLGRYHSRYSLVRVWGSAGFIVAVLGIGAWLENHPVDHVPALVMIFLVGIVLVTLLIPEAPQQVHKTEEGDATLKNVMRQRHVISLFLVFFLMQASHGPYYSFFSIYLEDLGYSSSRIGQLWALGVFAEIGVFLLMPRLLPKYGAKALLVFALVASTARWLMIAGFAGKMVILLFAQVLHLASFGIYHAVAVTFVHRTFTGPLQGRGQALYSSLGFGAGGAAGSLVAGYTWTAISPAAIFVVAAGMTAVATGIAVVGVERLRQAG